MHLLHFFPCEQDHENELGLGLFFKNADMPPHSRLRRGGGEMAKIKKKCYWSSKHIMVGVVLSDVIVGVALSWV